jgi:chromosome segregation ATPase
MKNRIVTILLGLICLGLGAALVVVKRQASEQQRVDADRIEILSNKWVTTTAKVDEQAQVLAMYQGDIEKQKKAFQDLTNSFTQVSESLGQTKETLETTRTSLKTAEDEIKKRDTRIAALEAQNQTLDKQAVELSTAITNLTTQITETRRKLAASEGDRASLEAQLKRLISEKSDLERQFNDLTILRAQVAKLKEELTIARRVEWIRRGLFASGEQKGATKLMSGVNATPQTKAPKPNYDLNVEITTEGESRIIPRNAATNSPPK